MPRGLASLLCSARSSRLSRDRVFRAGARSRFRHRALAGRDRVVAPKGLDVAGPGWPVTRKSGAPLVVLLDALAGCGQRGDHLFAPPKHSGPRGWSYSGGLRAPCMNGKLMGASAGSLFRVPILAQVIRGEALGRLTDAGCRIFGLDPASAGLRTGERAWAELRGGRSRPTIESPASQTYDLWVLNVEAFARHCAGYRQRRRRFVARGVGERSPAFHSHAGCRVPECRRGLLHCPI